MGDTPSRIGGYPVEREIGRGGMGIVYLARDPRLDRAVAIKVLPDAFARDPERIARFEREAKLLASLNHPNIAGIHGLEEFDGHRFLTLEYVEGPTLAERLARGALPVEETLDVCRQIASAVEAAHENGVIHRDLKPGNVKLTPGGEVKVLDFGLAKGAAGAVSSISDLSKSPTVADAPTGAGVILGTAAYMSPEQARGKLVDRRTDIWSFGCVLYECLTGRQAFGGDTVSDMIARILQGEPDWSVLPGKTPPRVRELLLRCLEKDAKKRLRDIGEARVELEEAVLVRTPGGRAAGVRHAGAPAVATRSRAALPIGIAVALLAGFALGFAGRGLLWPTAGSGRPPARVSVPLPAGIEFQSRFTATPDGRSLILVGIDKEKRAGKEVRVPRIYIRRLDRAGVEALAGTEGVSTETLPQASKDGRSVFFLARALEEGSPVRMMRAPLDGSSPPVAVMEWSHTWQGFTLLEGGEYLMLADRGTSLVRVPAGGGPPAAPVRIDAGPDTLTYTGLDNGSWLDERGLLLNAIAYGKRGYTIGTAVVDPGTGKATRILEDGGNAVKVPGGPLLFTRADNLLAADLDGRTLRIRGTPAAVQTGLRTANSYLPAPFRMLGDGSLAYAPGGKSGLDRRLVVMGSDGNILTTFEETKPYWAPQATPDGRRFAVTATNPRAIDEIWVSDPGRPDLRRLVAMPDADCYFPVLTDDGESIAFRRQANDGLSGVYLQRLQDGEASRSRILADSAQTRYEPMSWSPGAEHLVVVAGRPGPDDILLLSRTPRGAWRRSSLVASPANEYWGLFSPDGRWLTFNSDESGQDEVYVCSFGADGRTGPPVRVSRGARGPGFWVDGGRRLIYTGESRLEVVAVETEPSLRVSASEDALDVTSLGVSEAWILPDGRALAVLKGEGEGDPTRLDLVFDWTRELGRLRATEGSASR